MAPRIFLTHTPDDLRRFYDGVALERLRALGEVRLHPTERHLTPPELLAAAGDAHFIISEWATGADAAFFREATALVAFIRCGVEIRNVDFPAAGAAGVLIVNTPGLYTTAVVELVLGLIICLARDVVNRCAALRRGQATADRFGSELRGKTLGLVGYGDIARALARAATHLGMRVVFADPYVEAGDAYGRAATFEELLGEADFVSLHAKWTPETEGLMGEAAFARMKPGAFFINTARGALVDEVALLAALQTGRLAGAALDVFGNEPEIVGNPLLAMPQVIATPHIGGITPETMRAQAARTVAIVEEILSGAIPRGSLNAMEVQRPRLERLGSSP